MVVNRLSLPKRQAWLVRGLAAILLMVVAGGPVPLMAEERFEFTSYRDVERLFEELGYTREAWQAGIREVPRAFLTEIPAQWRDRYSKEVSVVTKKRIFFRSFAPLLLRSNELIMQDRLRLIGLMERGSACNELSDDEKDWLRDLAVRYQVIRSPDDELNEARLDEAGFDELLMRVDIIPLSIALSQAAEESGWGTSRFAVVGNSLFGQWTWGSGITPGKQRRRKYGDYRIAAFDSPLESVKSYARNLNTHVAYQDLRWRRADLRRRGQPVRGKDLVETLGNYSERGHAYINTLRTIMRVNKLDSADAAYLGDGPVIHLVPINDL